MNPSPDRLPMDETPLGLSRSSSSFRILPDLDLLVTDFSGHVRGSDFRELYERAYQDPAYEFGMNEFVDLSRADPLDFTFGELRAVDALVTRTYTGRPETFRTALYVARPVVYGMGRMYQAISSHGIERTRVFDDPEEALSWLRVPRERWRDVRASGPPPR